MEFQAMLYTLRRAMRPALAASAAYALSCLAAGAAELAPQTTINVRVVQWMPVSSSYEEWAALGGQYSVSGNGEITLPVVGKLDVKDKDKDQVADEVAAALQKKTGLVSKPEVSITVIEYPPIYVTGSVTTPGEYRFREGMTVIHAMALSGGLPRAADGDATVQLMLDLRTQNDQIMLSTARVARLEAELSGATEITFPDLSQLDTSGLAQGIYERERILFDARAKEVERQEDALSELKSLFEQEASVLEQRREANDQAVVNAEKELKGVSSLVDKGFAVASRKSEMERIVSGLKADSLDQVTAMMRARQGGAQATRDLNALKDSRRSQVAADLQTAKADLEQAKARLTTAQNVLFRTLNAPVGTDKMAPVQLVFKIVRSMNGKAETLDADETTMLRAGDVLSVAQATAAVAAGQE